MKNLINQIQSYRGRPLTIMEVCGTHTMQIAKMGLKSLLKDNIRIRSGPGCPVCVTPVGFFDKAAELASLPDTVVATFGDLVRVPGTRGSLQESFGNVQVVYSPLQVLDIALAQPEKTVVFLGVGFETTVPVIAFMITEAQRRGIQNLYILPELKTMPYILEYLIAGGSMIDGFLYPGHVAAIIGEEPFDRISRTYSVPGVIAGFEDEEILFAVAYLIRMIENKDYCAKNLYPQIVREKGNLAAQELISQVFCRGGSEWRGFGNIEHTGLILKEEWKRFDIGSKYSLSLSEALSSENKSYHICRCGDILNGRIEPPDCPLYGKKCTPQNPAGACMVSSEGVCAAYYRYSFTGKEREI